MTEVGFRPKRAPLKLDFTGTEYEGLEVTARTVPMSVMFDIVGASNSGNPVALRQVAATLGYALEAWNVEDDDGQPVPADLDGLMSQDAQFYDTVLKAWLAAMTGMPRGGDGP